MIFLHVDTVFQVSHCEVGYINECTSLNDDWSAAADPAMRLKSCTLYNCTEFFSKLSILWEIQRTSQNVAKGKKWATSMNARH